MVSRQTLSEQFDDLGVEPSNEILDKCIEICGNNGVTDPVEFVEQWMAYSLSKLQGAEPTISYLTEMERKEYTNRKNTLKTKSSFTDVPSDLKIYNYGSNNVIDVGDIDIIESYSCHTPKAPTQRPRLQNVPEVLFSPACYSPMSIGQKTTKSDEKSGAPIYTFGSSAVINKISWENTIPKNLNITQISPQMTANDKYMLDSLNDKCKQAGDTLYEIGTEIYEKFSNKLPLNENSQTQNQTQIQETDEIVGVDMPSQDVVACIGRICCDTDNRLDMASTVIVGSDELKFKSSQLNLNKMQSFGIFPGQTVLVRGLNPRGDTLYAQEIHSEINLEISSFKNVLRQNPISMVIAAGPFTFSDDIAHAPLNEVLNYCKLNKPDVLILSGPVFDDKNEILNDCSNLATSFDIMLENLIAAIMNGVGQEIQVIMISSSNDIESSGVYPTHPYAIKNEYRNLKFLPDPCIFEIEGIKIGITATDIIKHLSEEELVINGGHDKIKRHVNYLYHQQSFYPLNPPHLDVSLDSILYNKFSKLKVVPNMMILPSDLKCYVRDIHNCLTINPGRVADKQGSGTFARLVINPVEEDDAKLFNFVGCQVIKI